MSKAEESESQPSKSDTSNALDADALRSVQIRQQYLRNLSISQRPPQQLLEDMNRAFEQQNTNHSTIPVLAPNAKMMCTLCHRQQFTRDFTCPDCFNQELDEKNEVKQVWKAENTELMSKYGAILRMRQQREMQSDEALPHQIRIVRQLNLRKLITQKKTELQAMKQKIANKRKSLDKRRAFCNKQISQCQRRWKRVLGDIPAYNDKNEHKFESRYNVCRYMTINAVLSLAKLYRLSIHTTSSNDSSADSSTTLTDSYSAKTAHRGNRPKALYASIQDIRMPLQMTSTNVVDFFIRNARHWTPIHPRLERYYAEETQRRRKESETMAAASKKRFSFNIYPFSPTVNARGEEDFSFNRQRSSSVSSDTGAPSQSYRKPSGTQQAVANFPSTPKGLLDGFDLDSMASAHGHGKSMAGLGAYHTKKKKNKPKRRYRSSSIADAPAASSNASLTVLGVLGSQTPTPTRKAFSPTSSVSSISNSGHSSTPPSMDMGSSLSSSVDRGSALTTTAVDNTSNNEHRDKTSGMRPRTDSMSRIDELQPRTDDELVELHHLPHKGHACCAALENIVRFVLTVSGYLNIDLLYPMHNFYIDPTNRMVLMAYIEDKHCRVFRLYWNDIDKSIIPIRESKPPSNEPPTLTTPKRNSVTSLNHSSSPSTRTVDDSDVTGPPPLVPAYLQKGVEGTRSSGDLGSPFRRGLTSVHKLRIEEMQRQTQQSQTPHAQQIQTHAQPQLYPNSSPQHHRSRSSSMDGSQNAGSMLTDRPTVRFGSPRLPPIQGSPATVGVDRSPQLSRRHSMYNRPQPSNHSPQSTQRRSAYGAGAAFLSRLSPINTSVATPVATESKQSPPIKYFAHNHEFSIALSLLDQNIRYLCTEAGVEPRILHHFEFIPNLLHLLRHLRELKRTYESEKQSKNTAIMTTSNLKSSVDDSKVIFNTLGTTLTAVPHLTSKKTQNKTAHLSTNAVPSVMIPIEGVEPSQSVVMGVPTLTSDNQHHSTGTITDGSVVLSEEDEWGSTVDDNNGNNIGSSLMAEQSQVSKSIFASLAESAGLSRVVQKTTQLLPAATGILTRVGSLGPLQQQSSEESDQMFLQSSPMEALPNRRMNGNAEENDEWDLVDMDID